MGKVHTPSDTTVHGNIPSHRAISKGTIVSVTCGRGGFLAVEKPGSDIRPTGDVPSHRPGDTADRCISGRQDGRFSVRRTFFAHSNISSVSIQLIFTKRSNLIESTMGDGARPRQDLLQERKRAVLYIYICINAVAVETRPLHTSGGPDQRTVRTDRCHRSAASVHTSFHGGLSTGSE